MFSETVVEAINSVPPPFVPVHHPPNVYPVFVGAVGSEPTVVEGTVTVFVAGFASVVAL